MSEGTAPYSLDQIYPGTSPFPEDWADRFFGRSIETDDLENLTHTYPIVLLYGESGTGKSSLIHAGLKPALGREHCKVCRVSGLLPGIAPDDIDNIFVFHLLMSLAGERAKPDDLKSGTLAGALPGLLDGMEQKHPKRWHIFVDQCEEILTTHPERWKDRASFFEQVRGAVELYPNLHFIMVAREEYLASFERYEGLLPDGFRIRYYLERLSGPAAREAIMEPAGLAGIDTQNLEIARIVDKVVVELLKTPVEVDGVTREIAGEFIEPLHLQIVCRELAQSGFKTGSAGSVTGDVSAALVRYYDASVKGAARAVPFRELRLRWFIQRNLVTPAGTRGLVYESKAKGRLGGVSPKALRDLEQTKILRLENRGGARWYELSHDRLINPILRSNARRFRRVKGVLYLAAGLLAIGWPASTLFTERSRLDQLNKQVTVLHQANEALREALRHPEDAASIALPLWQNGDLDQARGVFSIGRDKAPLENILYLDSALAGAQKRGDQAAIAACKTARKEFLRYPVIAERMKTSTELRDYVCTHNFAVIGGSYEKEENAINDLRGALKKYPNAEVGQPPPDSKKRYWTLIMDAFLSCEEAQKLGVKVHEERNTGFFMPVWYACPEHCTGPEYNAAKTGGDVILPSATMGKQYTFPMPGTKCAVREGALPTGLRLSPPSDSADRCRITGVPVNPGNARFQYEYNRPDGYTTSSWYQLVVKK